MGASDALFVGAELGVDCDELRELPNWHATVRLLANGRLAPQFTLQTIPPGDGRR